MRGKSIPGDAVLPEGGFERTGEILGIFATGKIFLEAASVHHTEVGLPFDHTGRVLLLSNLHIHPSHGMERFAGKSCTIVHAFFVIWRALVTLAVPWWPFRSGQQKGL